MKMVIFGITWDFKPLLVFIGLVFYVFYLSGLAMLGFGSLFADTPMQGILFLLGALFGFFAPHWVFFTIVNHKEQQK